MVHIELVEIANFRKLLATRITLAQDTTLFVGANNSGKTSAMLALRRFLVPRRSPFDIHDFTLCHWPAIDAIGEGWLTARKEGNASELAIETWAAVLPTLDLWLHVEVDEMHHVRGLIPSLDWEGGRLGVRLRYEPKDFAALFKDYTEEIDRADAVRAVAGPAKLTVWPVSLVDFLSRRLPAHFMIRAYTLDPAGLRDPEKLQSRPQELAPQAQPIEGDPLNGLVRVHDIPALRGFGEERSAEDAASPTGSASRLSEQLRNYYARHLDPNKAPVPEDIEAIRAIEAAQDAFDKRLTKSFEAAFVEVQGLGYPGMTGDPRPHVATRLKVTDGLNHSAAVSFQVDVVPGAGMPVAQMRLPESSNGLGYQNLISMIFQLMGFRDAWMNVAKAAADPEARNATEPLHLVLIEEPEAHLHVQVQQVFIKKAYDVLRKHSDLGDSKRLRTQLVVSTHSSHVAHETPFSSLRYFRRLPAGMAATVPVSTVVNLSGAFGASDETERFVTRYLHAEHADLFFADAAILVEGPAERILLPNLIRQHYPELDQRYLTLLEIGGSHAHRLRPLIERLGLLTLVVTDLDSLNETGGRAVPPATGSGQKTNNATLKGWVPNREDIDDLVATKAEDKVLATPGDSLYAVRVAYQTPLMVTIEAGKAPETAHPYTFEDALVFQNLTFFSTLQGHGLVKKFRDAIAAAGDARTLGGEMFGALRDGKKAEFALDVLMAKDFDKIAVPRYIAEGLEWLRSRLVKPGEGKP